MILQSNQKRSFHLHIPDVHLSVAVLKNIQAPAKITRTLITMTLPFSTTYFFALFLQTVNFKCCGVGLCGCG